MSVSHRPSTDREDERKGKNYFTEVLRKNTKKQQYLQGIKRIKSNTESQKGYKGFLFQKRSISKTIQPKTI